MFLILLVAGNWNVWTDQ